MKATNKDKAQKMISAKIAKKLVELANKYVVPCIKINAPGKYSSKEMADDVDSLGNKLFWGFDYDNSEVQELVVRIADDDFSQSELAELGFSPKIKLTLICEKVFLAIAKYEQLAGVRGNNVAKFVVGEPATIYETERAKVTIYERGADTIVTKTKKITIISDTQAVYRQDKKTITLCLKINGKWFAVHTLSMAAYDFDAIAEIVLKRYTIDNIRKGVKATANSQVCNKFVEFCRFIQSELDSMDKLNAEASNTQAADNVTADSEGNANVATETASKANAETAQSTGKDTAEPQPNGNADKATQSGGNSDSPQAASKDGGRTETPPKNEVPPKSPANKTIGRKSAVLSDFRGKGDKVYRQSSENRNLGVYGGISGVSQETSRGSPQKQTSTI